MIAKESIEELKSSIDIVDVISYYIPLKKSGANYVAICPFHSEKTASFNVNPQKQIYHCFGCGASGDAINFVKEYEHLSYPEAIEKIASIFNFTLRYEQGKGREYSKLLDELNAMFKKELFVNKDALKYLKGRRVSDLTIERFSIGYAPSSAKVIEFLKSKAYKPEDGIKSGVLIHNDRGYYFRFEDRITFPIYTPFGKIVGFGGRTLGAHKAKYLNSPQSAIFNKSKLLYGYHQAREEIHSKNEIIITEGYMDVVMLHQAGFKNSVATLGTALNNGHIPLIKKGEPKVIVAYDGDSAGKEAAFRASVLLLSSHIEGFVVLFEDGADPADLVSKERINELHKIFENKQPLLEYVIDTTLARYDLNNPYQKQRAYDSVIELLKTFPTFVAESGAEMLAYRLRTTQKSIINAITHKSRKQSKEVDKGGVVNKKIDLLEGGIIKACLEDEGILEYVLDIVDESFFVNYKEEFLALLVDKKSPILQSIIVNPVIIATSKENIKKDISKLIEKRCLRDIESISSSKELKEEEKRFKIKEIRFVLDRIKRGEMVVYEGVGAI